MKKVRTGIKGFDKLIQGGIPKGSTILLCGTPGTAKTIFGMEYLYNGANNYNEKGLYVSFEEKRSHLIEQGKMFKWDLKELEKQGLLKILSIPVEQIDKDTVNNIIKLVKEEGFDRLVIDSLSTLSINAPIYTAIHDLFLRDLIMRKDIFSPSISDDFILKRFVYSFINQLQETDVTSLLISEIGKDTQYLSRDTVSEFLADGIIHIVFESMGGKYSRSLLVRKMRHIKNDEDIHPLEISKTGLIVHDIEN